MKVIKYKIHHQVTEELLTHRYEAFNERHGFYSGTNSALEPFDAQAFHLVVSVDGEFAGALRLTECPCNFMTVNLVSELTWPNGPEVLELGRVFVVPKFRGMKLLNVLLLAGLRVSEQLGYEVVVGTETHRANLRMPDTMGFSFTNVTADFSFPGQVAGILRNELVIQCDLAATRELRQRKAAEYRQLFAERSYALELW